MIGGEPPGADVKLDVLIDRKQFFFLTYAFASLYFQWLWNGLLWQNIEYIWAHKLWQLRKYPPRSVSVAGEEERNGRTRAFLLSISRSELFRLAFSRFYTYSDGQALADRTRKRGASNCGII